MTKINAYKLIKLLKSKELEKKFVALMMDKYSTINMNKIDIEVLKKELTDFVQSRIDIIEPFVKSIKENINQLKNGNSNI